MAIDNYPLAPHSDESSGVRTGNLLPELLRRLVRRTDSRDATDPIDITDASVAAKSEVDDRENRVVLPTQREPGSGPFGPDDQWDVMHREEFIEQLEERLETGEPMALIAFGMDQFGEVNRTAGLAAGDAALRNAYRVLRWMLGPSNVAYIGSDRYAALLPYTDEQTTTDLVQKALDRLARVDLSDHLSGVLATASAGIVVLKDSGVTVDDVLYEAEYALMSAKEKGGSRLAIGASPCPTR